MKKDLRTIRTTTAIQTTFIDILQEKSFNKVTVSEIAKRAYIDRQTF
ncbi:MULTISPECIES: hypothetical protein [Lactobacillus]|nr:MULTISPECIES: hypothetical protein [Lactobacillus]